MHNEKNSTAFPTLNPDSYWSEFIGSINIKSSSSLGFRFTHEDDLRILMACLSAIKFMENYGKGREPYTTEDAFVKLR